MQKERVVAILAAHDALRAEERVSFAAYLTKVFEYAEDIPAMQRAIDITALQSVVEALEHRVDDLNSQVMALQEALAPKEVPAAPEAPVPAAPEVPAAQ